MRVHFRKSRLFINLVAADVRRLIPIRAKDARASSRRLPQFNDAIRETFGWPKRRTPWLIGGEPMRARALPKYNAVIFWPPSVSQICYQFHTPDGS